MFTVPTAVSKCRPIVAITSFSFLLVSIVSLTVLTSCGSAAAHQSTASSTATTAKPAVDTLAVSIAASPTTSGVAPFLVTFVASATSSTRSAISSWTWNFGDGIWCEDGPYCRLTVSHTFTNVATYPVSLSVTDAAGTTATASVTIVASSTVAADSDNTYCGIGNVPIGATVDGPADMPVRCVNSSLANTPSPGTTVTLAAGGNLQTAYNGLVCGQTLSLAHGAIWDGPIQFTPKGCDDQHWITITSDGALPPAGTRVDATYLPQLAAISMAPYASANMVTGDHLRFVGVAWLKGAGKPLVDFVEVSGATNIVFDRNYAHGNPGEETRRFINLTNGSYIAVVDSFIDEMHCIALGTCTDSQAITGGTDTSASGPFKIVNNYLSAAGENILFGGGSATNTPCDIEIRGNYMYKPISWNPSDPTYAGIKYVVKNLSELKNACRVLFEGNVLANTWGGFTQDGSALLIGPKNQGGANGTNLCPLCFVSDVIVRYNFFTTAAAAFEIFNVRTTNVGGWAASGHNYSVHDLVFDNLQYATCYECTSNLGELSSGYLSTDPPPVGDVMHDVLINHLTLITGPTWPLAGSKKEAAILMLDGPPAENISGTPQMSNIAFENSLAGGGNSGFYPTGGGPDNCSVGQKTLADMISACWTGNSLFSGNLVVGYTGTSTWPSGNLFSTSWSNVGFANYNDGNGGDYHLADSSPFKGQALDGTDPGANIDLVLQYTNSAR